MVLVDTSVWVRFLSDRAPYTTELDRLLSRDEVDAHEMVFGELLIGDLGRRTKLLAAYAQLPRSPTIPHAEVVEFVRARRLAGRGVGWVAVHLLASAFVGRSTLWSADSRLAALAVELGVAFDGA